jgi:tRNA dimethylallyltransferase
MVKSGLVEETKNLLKKHGEIPNLCGTIGYREMLSFIKGEISLEDAKNILKQNTRRYAKRQLTWFRRNEEIKWDIYPEMLRK